MVVVVLGYCQALQASALLLLLSFFVLFSPNCSFAVASWVLLFFFKFSSWFLRKWQRPRDSLVSVSPQ